MAAAWAVSRPHGGSSVTSGSVTQPGSGGWAWRSSRWWCSCSPRGAPEVVVRGPVGCQLTVQALLGRGAWLVLRVGRPGARAVAPAAPGDGRRAGRKGSRTPGCGHDSASRDCAVRLPAPRPTVEGGHTPAVVTWCRPDGQRGRGSRRRGRPARTTRPPRRGRPSGSVTRRAAAGDAGTV
jgi:hypothetical protein